MKKIAISKSKNDTQSEVNFYSEVFALTKKIPKGKVVSYGQIAVMLGSPRAARAVGYALNSLKKTGIDDVPWQRVINSKGEISFKGDTNRANLQRKLLEQEGVKFNMLNQIDFNISL
jgi:methylated-DNA-protein-cysteine methyltransferase related protein